MSELRRVTEEFKHFLFLEISKGGCADGVRIDTTYHQPYGELHRVFYDECDLANEDPKLVEVVLPFVKQSRMFTKFQDIQNLKDYFEPKPSNWFYKYLFYMGLFS